jgi:hypothetical protein
MFLRGNMVAGSSDSRLGALRSLVIPAGTARFLLEPTHAIGKELVNQTLFRENSTLEVKHKSKQGVFFNWKSAEPTLEKIWR